MKNTLDMEYNPQLTSVQVMTYDVFFWIHQKSDFYSDWYVPGETGNRR